MGSAGAGLLGELVGQPVQALVQTGTLSGAGGLDVPLRRQDSRSDAAAHEHLALPQVCHGSGGSGVCSYSSTPQAVQTQFVG